MQAQSTVPRITRERAERLIRAYACKAAHLMADTQRTPDEAVALIDQTRRQLGVRLWADVDRIDFEQLADKIAELRQTRRAGWDTQWESPYEKDQWLGSLRQMINAELDALAYTLAHKAA